MLPGWVDTVIVTQDSRLVLLPLLGFIPELSSFRLCGTQRLVIRNNINSVILNIYSCFLCHGELRKTQQGHEHGSSKTSCSGRSCPFHPSALLFPLAPAVVSPNGSTTTPGKSAESHGYPRWKSSLKELQRGRSAEQDGDVKANAMGHMMPKGNPGCCGLAPAIPHFLRNSGLHVATGSAAS